MRACGITDVGQSRTVNQDIFKIHLVPEYKQGVVLVCDGMGGANGGEVASKIAAETALNYIVSQLKPKMTTEFMSDVVKRAAAKANAEIMLTASKNADLLGMGTTFVCAMMEENRVVIGNVGDSRAYGIVNDKIKQITQDHSLVNDLIQAGELHPEEAHAHPKKNVITRALGAEVSTVCDIFTVEAQPNSHLLLCSDGLTNEVSDPELCYEVLNSNAPSESCKSLLSIANKRGGHDNITVVVVSF